MNWHRNFTSSLKQRKTGIILRINPSKHKERNDVHDSALSAHVIITAKEKNILSPREEHQAICARDMSHTE